MIPSAESSLPAGRAPLRIGPDTSTLRRIEYARGGRSTSQLLAVPSHGRAIASYGLHAMLADARPVSFVRMSSLLLLDSNSPVTKMGTCHSGAVAQDRTPAKIAFVAKHTGHFRHRPDLLRASVAHKEAHLRTSRLPPAEGSALAKRSLVVDRGATAWRLGDCSACRWQEPSPTPSLSERLRRSGCRWLTALPPRAPGPKSA